MTDVARLSLVFGADTSALDRGFAKAKALVKDYQANAAKSKDVALDADPSKLIKGVAQANAAVKSVPNEINTKVDVNTASALAKLAVFKAAASSDRGLVGSFNLASKTATNVFRLAIPAAIAASIAALQPLMGAAGIGGSAIASVGAGFGLIGLAASQTFSKIEVENGRFVAKTDAVLTKSQRDLVDHLNKAAKAYDEAFKPANDAFNRFASRAADVASKTFPRLGRAAEETTSSVGKAFDEVVKTLSKPHQLASYERFLDAVPGITSRFTRAAGNFFGGIANTLSEAVPWAKDLAGWIENISEDFLKWSQSDRGREQMREFFRVGARFAGNLATAVGDIATGLVDLSRNKSVQNFLNGFVEATGKLVKSLGRIADRADTALGDIFDWDTEAKNKVSNFGVKSAHQFATKYAEQQRREANQQEGEGSSSYEFGFKVGKSIGRGIDNALSGRAGGRDGGADNPIGDWLRSHVPGAAWLDDNVADPIVHKTIKGMKEGFARSETGKGLFNWVEKEWDKTGPLKWKGSALQEVYQKIITGSEEAKSKSSESQREMEINYENIWQRILRATPIFGKIFGFAIDKSREAKEKGGQAQRDLEQNYKNIWQRILEATPIFGTIASKIIDKSRESKEKAGDAQRDLETNSKNIWQRILEATPVWGTIASKIIGPSEEAESKTVSAWERIIDFINRVLSAVNLPTIKLDSGSSGSSGDASKRAGNVEGKRNGTVTGFARGGVALQPNTGGVSDGKRPYAVYGEGRRGEGPKKESYVVHGRRDNIPYAQAYARSVGMEMVPRTMLAVGGRHFASGGMWYPKTAAVNAEVERRYNVSGSTYAGHGADGDSMNSVDWMTGQGWGVAATGQFLARGDSIVNYLLSAQKSLTDYIIWQRKMWDSGGVGPYTGGGGYPAPTTVSGHHLDHVHWESLENNPGPSVGSGGGGFLSSLWDTVGSAIWNRLVQPAVDSLANSLRGSSLGLVGDVGAKLTTSTADKIKQYIIGESGSGGLPGGNSPSGLTLGEAVSQGGWPKNLQKTAVGVAWEESSANASARNPSGARGLFQIMPGTAKAVGADYSRLDDPIYNSATGVKVYNAQGWNAWVAYPPSASAMRRSGTPVQGYEKGGFVEGERGKPVPAILHGGEYVIPENVARYATGGISFNGPLAGQAIGVARSFWGSSGASFDYGPGFTVRWRQGIGAARTGNGIIGVDPQFAGSPLLDEILAHEIGHAGGLSHNWPASALMSNPVMQGDRPTSAELSAFGRGVGVSSAGGSSGSSGGGGSGGSGGSWRPSGSINRDSVHMTGGGSARTYSSQGSGAAGNAEMLRNSQRQANANEDAAQTLRRVERILARLPEGLKEGYIHNMKHGLDTGRGMDVSDVKRMARRLSGGAPIARPVRT